LGEKPDRVLLGDIGAAQGLKGEVRLRSFTAVPADIASYGPLEDEAGSRTIEIQSVRVTPKALIAHIKGVATREQAEALTGTKLYLPRGRLPESDADEWYHADLIGLTAVDGGGAPIGKVVAVHNFGAGDIIEIEPTAGGENLLVSFTAATVPEVDLTAGTLTLVMPEDLSD
jgi:16S rRNA processing protein RimM